jgi:phosphatidylserine/phosphatidylglycerophosphate/cardiolipin synthase-like enzyme
VTVQLPSGVERARLRLVSDATYADELRAIAARAVRRLLCSIFIVDVSPIRDDALAVDGVLEELDAATWRGVETRLLIGGSRRTVDLAQAAELARARALLRGISCRWLSSTDVRGSHVKLVVADDLVLTGSHNWSAGAWSGLQHQDSMLIDSPDVAAWAADAFRRQWKRAGEPEP